MTKEPENNDSRTGDERENTITSRIIALQGKLSDSAFAQKCNIPLSSMRKYLAGSMPGTDKTVQIAQANNVPVAWLATGEGSMHVGESAPTEVTKPTPGNKVGKEYALIPLYDVRAAAGHGAVVEEEQITDSLAFKQQWIHQELNANPNDLYLIYVDGESMEPTLRPGDIILVDRRSAQSVPRDGIYVLRMDGSLLVKRLQRLPGRKVNVTSDNQAYESFSLDLDSTIDDLAIIGRVVWAGRRL